MDAIALQAKNISKHFPGVLANDHINFDLRKGEIHTLLGENGAGKTTLMNILDGIYYPDEGEIYLNGKRVDIRSPFEATKNGIGMIHQHFMLVDTLTVLENVVLGLESQGFYLDKKNISEKIAGKVYIKGEEVTNLCPKAITKEGTNYIPSDRLKVGLVPNLNTVENAILRRYDKEPISRGIFLNYEEAAKYTRELVKQFNIMVPRENVPVKFLSGGNLQKLILAREIREEPALLIAVHPSRGLDVGATEFIRKKLLEERDQGVAILLISEDLEELLMISDRIGVIYEGEIEGIVDIDSADINEIGLMMAGVHKNPLDK